MRKVLSRLLCRLLDHKGPHGTAYKLKQESKNSALVTWECPRCGESISAIMLGYKNPGETIDSTPNFKPCVYVAKSAS